MIYTVLDMFNTIDPDKICDLEGAKIAIRLLLNVIEDFQSQLLSLREENQRLRDEINRLKGEQGKPKIKGNTSKPPPTNHSSEAERHQSRKRHKRSKKAEIQIDREIDFAWILNPVTDWDSMHTKYLLGELRTLRAQESGFGIDLSLHIEKMKEVLATREHIPNKVEAKAARQARAKGRGHGSRRR